MNGRYHVAISVEQVLSHSQSLMALRAQLLGGKMAAARPTQSVGTASGCVNLPADKFAGALGALPTVPADMFYVR